jgi:hypothetical protein
LFRLSAASIEGSLSVSLRIGHPNLLQGMFGWPFGTLASTFAFLCAQQRWSRVVGQISPRPEAGRAIAHRLLGSATRRCPRALYPGQ